MNDLDNYMARPLDDREEQPVLRDDFNNPIYEGEQYMYVDGFTVHLEEINQTAVEFMQKFGGEVRTAERE